MQTFATSILCATIASAVQVSHNADGDSRPWVNGTGFFGDPPVLNLRPMDNYKGGYNFEEEVK